MARFFSDMLSGMHRSRSHQSSHYFSSRDNRNLHSIGPCVCRCLWGIQSSTLDVQPIKYILIQISAAYGRKIFVEIQREC